MALHIKIECFGEIQKFLPATLELTFTNQQLFVADILKQVQENYPEAASALERCACAVGDEVLIRNSVLNRSCSLVLLSPVAGG